MSDTKTTVCSSGNQDDQIIYLEKSLPHGIAIGRTAYGYGIFCTKAFVKGEIMYIGEYTSIKAHDGPICLRTDHGEFPMDIQVHTVGRTDGTRECFYFDGFMNHSCDANTVSRAENNTVVNNTVVNNTAVNNTADRGSYARVAAHDLMPGEEITCNYLDFEWNCGVTKGFDDCKCGSEKCMRSIHGFQFLPKEEQLRRLHTVNDILAQEWGKENPHTRIVRTSIPEEVNVETRDGHGTVLVATRDFSVGDIVYTNTSVLVDTLKVDSIVMIYGRLPPAHIGPVVPGSMWQEPILSSREIDLQMHIVKRTENMVECYTFDSFCSHSCDSNCDHVYLPDSVTDHGWRTQYSIVARKPVSKGQVISCDYSALGEIDGFCFDCKCGEICCRGTVF
jgi:hypothetical protein